MQVLLAKNWARCLNHASERQELAGPGTHGPRNLLINRQKMLGTSLQPSYLQATTAGEHPVQTPIDRVRRLDNSHQDLARERLMKTFLMTAVSVLASAAYASQPSYDSLEDFCLQTQVDTPANCACGQATADDIMSDAEQEMTLTMMIEGQPPPFDTLEAHAAFLEKVARVTDGCGD